MSLTHHDDLELMAGDDWKILGTLLDVNGAPLDLTNAEIIWTLIDPNGDAVDMSWTVEKVDPTTSGKIVITVLRTATEWLKAGRYHDAARVNTALTDTVWVGTILVACDAFALLPAAE